MSERSDTLNVHIHTSSQQANTSHDQIPESQDVEDFWTSFISQLDLVNNQPIYFNSKPTTDINEKPALLCRRSDWYAQNQSNPITITGKNPNTPAKPETKWEKRTQTHFIDRKSLSSTKLKRREARYRPFYPSIILPKIPVECQNPTPEGSKQISKLHAPIS